MKTNIHYNHHLACAPSSMRKPSWDLWYLGDGLGNDDNLLSSSCNSWPISELRSLFPLTNLWDHGDGFGNDVKFFNSS